MSDAVERVHGCMDAIEDAVVDEAERTKRWSQHIYVALVFGYNELAMRAETLGEKAFYRMARERANEDAERPGVGVNIGDAVTVLTLPGGPPHIVFRDVDIELMRRTVAEHDTKASHSVVLEKSE